MMRCVVLGVNPVGEQEFAGLIKTPGDQQPEQDQADREVQAIISRQLHTVPHQTNGCQDSATHQEGEHPNKRKTAAQEEDQFRQQQDD